MVSFWYTKIDFAFKMVFLFISVTNLDIEIVREKWMVCAMGFFGFTRDEEILVES